MKINGLEFETEEIEMWEEANNNNPLAALWLVASGVMTRIQVVIMTARAKREKLNLFRNPFSEN